MSTTTAPLHALRRELCSIPPDNLDRHDLLKIRGVLIEVLATAENTIDHFLTTFLETQNMTATIEAPLDIDVALHDLDAADEATYRKLVFQLAAGESVDVASIRPICQAANRTVDDFRRHRQVAAERREAVADLGKSDAIAAKLPGLQATRNEAAEAVKRMREKHAAELAPLLALANAAATDYANSTSEAKSLRRIAIATLSRTTSHEYLAAFDRLSNVVRESAERLRELQESGRRKVGVRTALEQEIHEHEKEIARLSKSPNPGDALENRRKALAATQNDIADLDHLVDRIQSARREHEAAKAALAEHEATEFVDWRNMRFE